MRNPILRKDETIFARGRCSDLRLYLIQGPGGFRYCALSGKTNVGTFTFTKDAADARDALVARVREWKPRAEIRFY